jgi:hypothetical protein
MDRTKNMSVVVGIAIMLFAAVCVTANPQIFGTPLYALRMEQASSKMSFLPTEMNGFMYTAENGYTLNFDASGRCCNGELRDTYQFTCDFYPTCYNTCPVTCGRTCPDTCEGPTCSETCPNTCEETCPYTCDDTCDGPTCQSSCALGPGLTCGPECP